MINIAASLVDAINKILDEAVHLHPILPPSLLLFAHLKSVVEKDVGLELVEIGVHHRRILPVLSSSTPVFIHSEQRLHHFHHLILVLMPHGGAGIYPSDSVGGLCLGSGLL